MINFHQTQWVKKYLRAHKKIDRNTCIKNYITRLSSIILRLKEKGWVFKSGYDEKYNYWYHVIKAPKV